MQAGAGAAAFVVDMITVAARVALVWVLRRYCRGKYLNKVVNKTQSTANFAASRVL